jgi:tRNA 2-selenouridine synthase
LVEEPLQSRVENIYQEYILDTVLKHETPTEGLHVFDSFIRSVHKISKKLGGLRTAEILEDLKRCKNSFQQDGSLEENKIWIEKLLNWYYDPAYEMDLKKRRHLIKAKDNSFGLKVRIQTDLS